MTELNIWPTWEDGKCEICGKECVNQFREDLGYGFIGYLWRASYWKENVICTECVDELTEEEMEKLK